MTHMKTTVELDEARLKRVMHLAKVKTRKAALDIALRHAERALSINRLLESALPGSEYADVVDPDYDLPALRRRERPATK